MRVLCGGLGQCQCTLAEMNSAISDIAMQPIVNSQWFLSNPDPTVTVYGMVMDSPVDVPISEPECGIFPSRADLFRALRLHRGIVILELPARNIEGTMIEERAYRVVANSPLTAYQFNPLENVEVFSNDASLLLPTSTAGTDYWMMTREQTFDDLKGFVTSRRNIRYAS